MVVLSQAGVRAAAFCYSAQKGAAAAAHIIGYELLIRLLPKLDPTSFPCCNAAALRCPLRSRALRSTENSDVPVTDVRTLLIRLSYCRYAQVGSNTMTTHDSNGVGPEENNLGLLTEANCLYGENLTSGARLFATRKSGSQREGFSLESAVAGWQHQS